MFIVMLKGGMGGWLRVQDNPGEKGKQKGNFFHPSEDNKNSLPAMIRGHNIGLGF
jgi:hypothetical protein